MIRPATVVGGLPRVAHSGRDLMRLTEAFRFDAAEEIRGAFGGVSQKRMASAKVPGAGATFVSRAMNGDAANPLYRLGCLFVLGRILGVPKWRFQRWIDRAQKLLDKAYADVEAPPLEEVLKQDQELDTKDDALRYRASHGCLESARELVEVKRDQKAFARTTIWALSRRIAEAG